MKRHLPIVILLLFTTSFLAASSYPDLGNVGGPVGGDTTLSLEREAIDAFLNTWKNEAHPTTSSLLGGQLEAKIEENDWQLQQLSDVVGIQEAQLEFSLSQGRPTWGG